MTSENEMLEVLKAVRRELAMIRQQNTEMIGFLRDAEQEIPEFMRRFANYMHDLHDIKYMYEEHGQPAPIHLIQELERCDDRYRQLITKLNTDGGQFEKVRREMAADPLNRWDHTRLLAKQENGNETG